jgi:glycosyltransferase involved in cell wall biosynthesis
VSGIIVGGMHRSGTSLMTAFLEAGGWHPGEHTLSSPREMYREDSSFVAIHQNWLEAVLPPGDGHPDWGISDGGTVPRSFDHHHLEKMGSDTARFLSQRNSERERWVAKDPRGSLFLPMWLENTELKCVLVYRNPWDVVDSAIRLGHGRFCSEPRMILTAWLDYNMRLVEAVSSHSGQCILIASEALKTSTRAVWEALDLFVGIAGDIPHHLLEDKKFVHRTDHHAISALYKVVYPDHWTLLQELDRLAAVSRAVPSSSESRSSKQSARVLPSGSLPKGSGIQIIIPCKNDGDFLVEAIASVKESIVDNVELTIVNDGSTDSETLRVIESLSQLNYEVIHTDGVGLSQARNLAAERSQTCAVLPLDADNRLRPALLNEITKLENNTVDIIHGPWKKFGLHSDVVSPPDMTMDNLVWGNSIDACALIRRELLQQLGGWDAQLPFWEDWDLWLGAVQANARTEKIDEVAIEYLVRPHSLSRNVHEDKKQHKQVVAYITQKHLPLLGPTISRLVRDLHDFNGSVKNLEQKNLHLLQRHEQAVADQQVIRAQLSEELQRNEDLNSKVAHLQQVIQERDLRITMLSDEISALPSRKKRRRMLSAWWHVFLRRNSH